MKVTRSHCLRVTALLLVGTAQLAGQTPKEVVVLPGAQLFAITGKVEVGKEELDGAKRSS